MMMRRRQQNWMRQRLRNTGQRSQHTQIRRQRAQSKQAMTPHGSPVRGNGRATAWQVSLTAPAVPGREPRTAA